MQSQLRKSDIISCIGGDEFAILLLNANPNEGNIVVQNTRKSIEEKDFILDGIIINITVSIGVALLYGINDPYEESYKHVDRALYKAKAKG